MSVVVDFRNKDDVRTVIDMVLEQSGDSHNQETPFELCEEIVIKLNDNIDVSRKILVVSTLEFVYTIAMQLGDTSNVYFATPNKTKAKLAAKWIPKENIFICEGVLDNERLQNMKFDVVVGNPPYQKPGSKNTDNLWHSFLSTAHTLTKVQGYTSLIVPNSWSTNKKLYTEYFLNKNVLVINLNECKKHFSVNSTFSYFITQNTPNNTNHPTQLIVPTGQMMVPTLPTYGLGDVNTITFPVLTKILQNTKPFDYVTSYRYHTDNFSKNNEHFSTCKTTTHQHKVLHKTKNKKPYYFYVDFIDDKQNQHNRVVVNGWVANYKDMMVCTNNELFCQQYGFFSVTSPSEAETLHQVLLSNVYRFIHHILSTNKKSHNLTIMGNFPKIDLSRAWTDQELYAHFNLTTEEIQLIEETIK